MTIYYAIKIWFRERRRRAYRRAFKRVNGFSPRRMDVPSDL